MTFPNVGSLAKSSDGSEYIYGGSVAINRILGYLMEYAGHYQSHKWKLFFVNIATLVANVYTNAKTDKQILTDVYKEMEMLNIFIDNYGQSFNRDSYAPTIAYYLPNYAAIPQDRLRDNSNNAEGRISALYEKIRSSFPLKSTALSQSPTLNTWCLVVGDRMRLPYLYLMDWAKSSSGISYKYNQHECCMISNYTIDWYLSEKLKYFHLLVRYIRNPPLVKNELGGLLLKEVDLPFNRIVHNLFGDKTQIKPLVSGRQKTLFIEEIIKNKWHRLTQTEFLDRACQFLKIDRTLVLKIPIL